MWEVYRLISLDQLVKKNTYTWNIVWFFFKLLSCSITKLFLKIKSTEALFLSDFYFEVSLQPVALTFSTIGHKSSGLCFFWCLIFWDTVTDKTKTVLWASLELHLLNLTSSFTHADQIACYCQTKRTLEELSLFGLSFLPLLDRLLCTQVL